MAKWQWLAVGILVGLGVALVVHAQTTTETTPTDIGNPWIQNNVAYKPNPPSESQPETTKPSGSGYVPKVPGVPLRNSRGISEQTIRQYLESKNSPLATYAKEISDSPYSGTIIGICTIEQYSCAKAPSFSPYNFWGIMKPGGGLAKYGSYLEGIQAIENWLTKWEPTHPTIQSLRGFYCASACTNWEPTVLKVKTLLESYETQSK